MNYVIVTPAFNEAKYISETIKSVLAQTTRPLLWVIVDDGSTDRMAEIVKRYALAHSWIQYIYRQKEIGQTYYASNVYAIQHGIGIVQNSTLNTQNYRFIGILDADISLPRDYYDKVAQIFAVDKKLGIVSGNCADKIGDRFRKHLYDRRSCAKAIMVFRRECFEQIGGFVPMKFGGEDTIACFEARRLGWKTWAQHEITVAHNKPLGTGPSSNMLKIRFRQGMGEYFLGSHPLFVLLKSLRRCIKEAPYGIGGFMRLSGFIYASFKREKRQIPDDLVQFIRKEQFVRVCKGNKIPSEYEVVTSK